MNKEFLIELTKNIYRITLLFPKKEPLRYKMRELADDILAKYQRTGASNNLMGDENTFSSFILLRSLSEDLEILDSFFEVAKNQNWVPLTEILKFQDDYGIIKEEIRKASTPPQPAAVKIEAPQEVIVIPPPQPEIKVENPSDARQKKILEILREKGSAQVWEIQKIFPNITKRTLRRDFRHLLKVGLVERLGERNETFYKIK